MPMGCGMYWLVVLVLGILMWMWIWADHKKWREYEIAEKERIGFSLIQFPMLWWGFLGAAGLIIMLVGCIGFARNGL